MKKPADKFIQMTGSKLVIDTNIAIDYFKENSRVTSIIQEQDHLYMPSIVLGELYVGARRSDNSAAKMAEVDELLKNCSVLHITHDVIKEYASV